MISSDETLLKSGLYSDEDGFDTKQWSLMNLVRCGDLRLMSSEKDVESCMMTATNQENVAAHTDIPPRLIRRRKSISELWLLRYGKESIKMLGFDIAQFVVFISGMPVVVPVKISDLI